ncbi:MFS transporter [Gordonia metallireducens]|uniref:MFS transporter n=1 Tax=Gordonia metallireducens TaxID=2897779 RepID=UPI001E3E2671|nr:MFS transporter [Gordonia metallireducens]
MTNNNVIDDSPLTNFHKRLLVQSAGGPFLDGWLLSIIGIALVGMQNELDLSTTDTSLAGAAALIGIFFGGLAFGRLTDRIGRQLMYTVDLCVLVGASALSVFADSAWQIIALRFIIGVAIGADYPIATALLTEWLPARYRGALVGSLIAFWCLGATIALFLGWGLVAWFGDDAWRLILGSSLIPGLIILVLRIGTPESPRWLMSKGRNEEAQQVVRRVYGQDADVSSLVDVETATDSVRYRELFRGEYGRRVFFCGAFFVAAITPVFAMYSFGPQILSQVGMAEGNMSNLGSALISLLFLIGCIPALWWTESLGRRPLLIWSFVGMLIPLVALGVLPQAGWFVLLCFAIYALASGGPNILEWSYPNELFPTAIRATAMGLITAISRIGAAVGTFLIPIGLESWGVKNIMLAAAALTLFGLVVSVLMAPETKGMSLTEASGEGTPVRSKAKLS